MRPIKFRGRDAYGKLHYGDLWQRTDGMIIFDHDEHLWQRVHPESVAQLIGVDKNGFEIYEGDLVVRIAGDEDFDPEKTFHMAATFEDFSAIRDEEIVLEEGLIKIRDQSRN